MREACGIAPAMSCTSSTRAGRSRMAFPTVQHDVGDGPIVHRGGHVRTELLPTAVGRRARIEHSQATLRGRVPREGTVPEDPYVGVGIQLGHPCVAAA